MANRARPRPAQVQRGTGRREAIADARDISASRVGRWRHQAVAEGSEAVRERQVKVPRSSRLDGAGEAHLLQWAQSTPPAGQARGMLRTLAREGARGIVPRISQETVRCTLKNELTD